MPFRMLLNDIQLTGLVLFPVALLGTVFNWTAVFVIHKLPSFRQSFGYLSSGQAFADAIHSTFFMIYFCPMVISGSEFLTEYSKHCGFILLFSYELSVQIHLVISLNRFFAAWAPYRYKKLFSDWNTKILIVIVLILTLISSFTFYKVMCSLEYSPKTGFFFFTDTPLCNAIGWFADFCKYFTIIIIIVILDISTVLKVRNNLVEFSESSLIPVQTSVDLQTTHRMSIREINFLKQTIFQGFIFALELVTYFILPAHLSNKWAIFFCTSFAWVAVHALDGVIIMIFNPEFKKYLFSCGYSHIRTISHPSQATHTQALDRHSSSKF
ncbi:CRE-SRX-59 protein [Caenorhabditis remanei]|uniref:CRE-SRX-59 protein n=1 Tax=Caenorhabditis remanei TaxID=31234 RepID=E3LPI1_CAERE|nr:CRE-SRX-59 protein [Caenorhabditis remanei]